jgi:hypothetical protein
VRLPRAADVVLPVDQREARAGQGVDQVLGRVDAGDAGAHDQHVEIGARGIVRGRRGRNAGARVD